MIYNYNKDSFFFTSSQEVFYDPIDNLPMLPAHSTLIEPLPPIGFLSKFDEALDEWGYIEDITGEWYNLETGEKIEVSSTSIDNFDSIKHLFTKVKPPKENKIFFFNHKAQAWRVDTDKEKERLFRYFISPLRNAVAQKAGGKNISCVRYDACMSFIDDDTTKAIELFEPIALTLGISLADYIEQLNSEINILAELERDIFILEIELKADIEDNINGDYEPDISSFITTRVMPLVIELI